MGQLILSCEPPAFYGVATAWLETYTEAFQLPHMVKMYSSVFSLNYLTCKKTGSEKGATGSISRSIQVRERNSNPSQGICNPILWTPVFYLCLF
jgi:hypothetical protein